MKTLIPVLDGANFLPAVRYVVREFLNGERVELHLLHIRSAFSLASNGLKPGLALLERFRIPYLVHLEVGDKATAIDAVARRVGAHRIVLGTARSGSVTGMAQSSTINKVLDNASVPVILVSGKSVSRLERYGIAAGLGVTLWLILSA